MVCPDLGPAVAARVELREAAVAAQSRPIIPSEAVAASQKEPAALPLTSSLFCLLFRSGRRCGFFNGLQPQLAQLSLMLQYDSTVFYFFHCFRAQVRSG